MEDKELSDYLSAFRRYWHHCLLIVVAVMIICALLAFLLPPVYRSTATILIEEQEIPSDLVRSTITSFAAQRLQTISQRVMTRSNLIAIIDKFNLYAEDRKTHTIDEIVERMRQEISFQAVSADVIDPRSGHPTQAMIAFTLSYDGSDPGQAQKIDNEVTSLYLEENLRMRTRQTAEASGFLTGEVAQIGAYATELEQKLSSFKEAHLNELPEHKQLTMQMIERTEGELKDIDFQLRALQERNVLIDSQIGQISPENPSISSTGQRVMSSTERLKALRTESISLASQYSEKHPDLVKTRREIQSLENEVGQVDPTIDYARRLNELRDKKSALLDDHAEKHPDAHALDKEIAALEQAIAHFGALDNHAGKSVVVANNPAYLGLSAQKQTNSLEIAGLSKRRAELQAKMREYEKRVRNSPDVERQYFALVRDWENTNNRYREMKVKQMEAQIAEQLERKSKGERFSIIEPPLLPEKPTKPNRPVILMLGFLAAIVASGGYVGVRETLDQSIRKAVQITQLVGMPPLAVIPYLEPESKAKISAKQLFIIFCLVALILFCGLLLMHWLWSPVDVLWFRSLRRLEQLLS